MQGKLALLEEIGQSVWLDSISRELLRSGRLARYVREWGVSGLTSNPTILAHAIEGSSDYDDAIAALVDKGVDDPEDLVYELAIEDLSEAAALLGPAFERSQGADGYVSIEVPPEYANATAETVSWAKRLRARFEVPNVLVKVPGTVAGLEAIRELIAAGIGVNVTLLFSVDQFVAAQTAYLEGLELRRRAGEDEVVPSVASVFVSRWDTAANKVLPPELHQEAAVTIACEIYAAYQEVLASERFESLASHGARAQRLLWASTSTKDPAYSDVFYLSALAAPNTITTVPESTLEAFFEHGVVESVLKRPLAETEAARAALEAHGVDFDALGRELQVEGAESFTRDWEALIAALQAKIHSER
jgi:transaldolase